MRQIFNIGKKNMKWKIHTAKKNAVCALFLRFEQIDFVTNRLH